MMSLNKLGPVEYFACLESPAKAATTTLLLGNRRSLQLKEPVNIFLLKASEISCCVSLLCLSLLKHRTCDSWTTLPFGVCFICESPAAYIALTSALMQ